MIDCGSKDDTVELAKRSGAKVYHHDFSDYASQKNYGIHQTTGQWVLFMDADGRVTPGLAVEIDKVIQHPKADAYRIARHNRILGRWMRFGGNASDYPMRLIKRGTGKFSGAVHEEIDFGGHSGRIDKHIEHYSTPSIAVYMRKLNQYTSLEVLKRLDRGPVSKRSLWGRPIGIFIKRYFLKLGFLDGIQGFLFAILSAYYDFVHLAKSWENENAQDLGHRVRIFER